MFSCKPAHNRDTGTTAGDSQSFLLDWDREGTNTEYTTIGKKPSRERSGLLLWRLRSQAHDHLSVYFSIAKNTNKNKTQTTTTNLRLS